MSDENLNVNLEFRAPSSGEEHFLLHDAQLVDSKSFRDAFAPILTAVAEALLFEVRVSEQLPAVVPPIRRRWVNTALTDDVIARAGDWLNIRWSAGTWSAEWVGTRADRVVMIGTASDGQGANYGTYTFVRPGDPATISVDELALSYVAGSPPSLALHGRVIFNACPIPPHRTIRVHADSDYDVPLRAGERFTVNFAIPANEPEMLDIAISVADSEPLVASPTISLRIPTALSGAEVSASGNEFAPRLFVREVPHSIRFRSGGYAPRSIHLRITATVGESAPKNVRARKVRTTATDVEYHLELDNDSTLTFSESVPGDLIIEVLGQDDPSHPPSTIELVPRSVTGYWEQHDSSVQLRIASSELNVDSVTALGSVFDIGGSSRIEPLERRFRDPGRIVTSVILGGHLSIALDDRAFTPAFPRDASAFWNDLVYLETAQGARFRLAEGDPDSHQLWNRLLGARDSDRLVLSLPRATQALISLPDNRRFTRRIADPFELQKHDAPFGVFFRGFCFIARLVRLEKSLGDAGLFLKLETPVAADERTSPPISAFLPIRVLRSPDDDALAFWEPPAPPVIVPFEDRLLVHDCIGYIYQSPTKKFWSRLPDVSPETTLKYVTFDSLVFSVGPTTTQFEGWWLPNGRGTFKASPPFRAYSFDFTEGASSAYEFELRNGELHRIVSGRWLSDDEVDELERAIRAWHATQSGSRTRTPVGPHEVDVRWRQRDTDGTLLVSATKVVDSWEVDLYALG
jgi:hypothetical protein